LSFALPRHYFLAVKFITFLGRNLQTGIISRPTLALMRGVRSFSYKESAGQSFRARAASLLCRQGGAINKRGGFRDERDNAP
jgi:hypothetical protein